MNDRFQGYPSIVAEGIKVFYQLQNAVSKYTRAFKKLHVMLNNGKSASYRIHRKFVALNQFQKVDDVSNEIVATKIELSKVSVELFWGVPCRALIVICSISIGKVFLCWSKMGMRNDQLFHSFYRCLGSVSVPLRLTL